MSLSAATIARYQPPNGDIYLQLQTEYGTQNANSIAAAAQTGDNNGEVAAAISQAEFGNPLDTSTADTLQNQLETDPLGAPLSGLETIVSNSLTDFLSSPAIILTGAVAAFFALGGLAVITKQFNRLK
jgi:hypothetical protein